MSASLSIGDFARATSLSVKTLRFYHESGLLEPIEIDPNSGYRRYETEQIPTAQVIRRFRELDVGLDDIRAIIAARDISRRNDLIAAHLGRVEQNLERTKAVVASLRGLLEHEEAGIRIEHRSIEATPSAAITAVIEIQDALACYQGALAELFATMTAHRLQPSGTPGGIFSNAIFENDGGEATVFIPCLDEVRPIGRVLPLVIPATELAVTTHSGSPSEIDRAYGALGTYVANHALAVDGPVREYYPVGAKESADESTWRTEIGWPIFATAAHTSVH
jgi:DNA-binding transcriptional MerR regulator